MLVNVEYIHHSGYVVETDNSVLIFDVVDGYLPRKYLDSNKNVVFFVSHSHDDHYNPGIFSYQKQVVVSDDVVVPIGHKAILVKPNDSVIVNGLKIKVFGSTDLGVSFFAQTDGVSIFHAGDLNYWHWKSVSSDDEIELAEFMFLNVLEDLRGLSVDIAMFPVDPRLGKDYDEGARKYIDTIRPTWFFPMHYTNARDLKAFDSWISKQDIAYQIPTRGNQAFICEVN